MLLLITFIAHSLLNYLNKRLKTKRVLKVDLITLPDEETEMFLFNESSFDNLAAHFDYSTVIATSTTVLNHEHINSTFDSLIIKPIDIHDINEEEYFEITSQQVTTNACVNLTDKNYDYELNSTLNSDNSSTCSESVYTSDLTLPKLSKSKSFRCTVKRYGKLRRAKLNRRYLKSHSLVIDSNNNSFDSFKTKKSLKTSRYSSKFTRRNHFQLRKRTSTLKSNTFLQSSHSSGSLASSKHISLLQSTNSYKPPIKIEKLLNDTRGMRKYLIDYDCLMSNNTNYNNKTCNLNDSTINNKHFNDSLIVMSNKFCSSYFTDDTDLIYQSSSNRCSSGYLSDC